MKKLIIITLAIVALCSCHNSADENEIFRLKTENENLKAELEGYRANPKKLIVEAKEAYKEKNYFALSDIDTKLRAYHPESQEAAEVAALYKKAKAEQTAAEEAEKAKKLASLKKLKSSYDDVDKITWYSPAPEHRNKSNRITMYIGETETSCFVRVKVSYTGDDWIFFKKIQITYADRTINIPFSSSDYESDHSDGEVYEWIDMAIDEETVLALRDMGRYGNAKIRLSGKYQKDRNLSSKELADLETVALAYFALKETKESN